MKNESNKYIFLSVIIVLLIIVGGAFLFSKTYSLDTSSINVCPNGWKYSSGKCLKGFKTIDECKGSISNLNITIDENNYCISKNDKHIAIVNTDDYLKNFNSKIVVYGNGGKFLSSDGKYSDTYEIESNYYTYSDNNVLYGANISFGSTRLINEGKILAGFSKNSECDNEIYSVSDYIAVSGDTKIYACYSDGYSVNYIADNAVEFSNKTISVNGTQYVDLPSVSKSGYTFVGWYDGKNNFIGKANDKYKVSKSITLYAKFNYNKTLSYKNSINDLGKCSDNYYYYLDEKNYCISDELKNIQSMLKELDYYSGNIDGRYTKKMYDSVTDFQSDYKLVINGILDDSVISNINNVYNKKSVVSKPNYYYIKYDADGGKFFDDSGSVNVYYGVDMIPEVYKFSPTRLGYTFIGWYLEDNLYSFNTKLSDNIVLKAKWISNSNTSYLCDDGDSYDSVTDMCYKIKKVSNIIYDYDVNGNVRERCVGICNTSINVNGNRVLMLSNVNLLDNLVSNVTSNDCNSNSKSCSTTVSNITYNTYKSGAVVSLIDNEVYDQYEGEYEDSYESVSDSYDDALFADESLFNDEGEILQTGDAGIIIVIGLVIMSIGIIMFLFNKNKEINA